MTIQQGPSIGLLGLNSGSRLSAVGSACRRLGMRRQAPPGRLRLPVSFFVFVSDEPLASRRRGPGNPSLDDLLRAGGCGSFPGAWKALFDIRFDKLLCRACNARQVQARRLEEKLRAEHKAHQEVTALQFEMRFRGCPCGSPEVAGPWCSYLQHPLFHGLINCPDCIPNSPNMQEAREMDGRFQSATKALAAAELDMAELRAELEKESSCRISEVNALRDQLQWFKVLNKPSSYV